MRIWLLLLGLAAVLIAFVLAGAAAAVVSEGAAHLKLALANELFTIPLAAAIEARPAFSTGAEVKPPL